MAEPTSPDNALEVLVKRIIGSPPPTPKMLSKLSFSRIGLDICLEAGFIDPVELRLAVEAVNAKKTPSPVSLYVTDRFLLPVGAIPEFLAALKVLVADLELIGKGGALDLGVGIPAGAKDA